jgi:uncharacterized protein (TIGR01777 family)
MERPRVLITGGTGLIGRALATALAASGHDVVLLSRSPDRAEALPANVRAARWDGTTASGWQDLADGAWAIVNLAGENIGGGRWTAAAKRRIVESRTRAGAAVAAAVAAARRKPRMLLQASAVGYYGNCGDRLLPESAGPGTGFLAATCVAWEASTFAVEAAGVRRAVARSGVVLSMAGGALPKLVLPYRLFAGGPMGDGRQWMPWIHLADEVRALHFLIEDERAAGAFNLCGPAPERNADFGRAIGDVLHRPSFMPAPAFALKAALGEMSTIVLEGQRCVPERLLALGFRFEHAELRPALADLLRPV